MKSELPPPAPHLSLQHKLDQIAHDREVLALLRELARQGLREGDMVSRSDGHAGQIAIERQDAAPRIVVVTPSGDREPFDRVSWRRI